MLREIADGKGTHFRVTGMAAHGGRSTTLAGLLGRHLIDVDYKITLAGRQILAADRNKVSDRQTQMF